MKYAYLLLVLPAIACAGEGDINYIDLKVGAAKARSVSYDHSSKELKGNSIYLEGTRLFADSTSFDRLKLGLFGGFGYQEIKDKKTQDGEQFLVRNIDLNAGGALNFELAERVNFYTKAGLVYTFSDAINRTPSEVQSKRDNGLGYTIGAGANVRVTDHLTFGVEYRNTRPYFERQNGHEYSQISNTWFISAGYQF